MRALLALTVANLKSYVRDRQAMFWTLAFPLIFIFLFGSIFSGGFNKTKLGWVDSDGSRAATVVHDGFVRLSGIDLVEGDRDTVLDEMRRGQVSGVIIVPQGFGAEFEAARAGSGPPAVVTVYTDPSQQAASGAIRGLVAAVVAQASLAGQPPAVVPDMRDLKTQDLNAISYLVPSILGMALMQLGVFSALRLVADRENLILKRLSATPLRRWQLVGSNVLIRLVIGAVQMALIMGVGAAVFHVEISGNLVAVAGFAVLGALAFISLGYVVASFAKTEDAANGMVSAIQFPLMFLSGTFFQIDAMPEFLRTVARLLPLTYLSDALRQTMVNGAAISPLWLCAAVLAGWSVVCFGISARFFRWQ